MSEVTQTLDRTSRARALEKTVLRKLDCRILPAVTILYLVSFLDRSNIGNAKIAGLEKDLHLHGTQFNTSLAVFFITYILSEIPSNIVMKKFKPNRWLGFLVAAWGLVTTLTGLTQNFAGLVAIRLLLGLLEGGLVPGVVLYLSCMYKRHELQFRIGIFYAAASLSGAFGGLLASGIVQMDGVLKLAGWRWIFILEGIATTILSIMTIFVLPCDVASAKFLTKEEKDYALWRLKQDDELPSIDHLHGTPKSDAIELRVTSYESPISDPMSEHEEFEWRELRRGIFDIQTWLNGLSFFGFITSLYSFSYFFPTIVSGLGYSGYQAQLHTVPPYVLAVVLTVAVSALSDRVKLRGPFVLVLLPLTMIGYIIAIESKTNTARYIGSCLIAAGTYASVPCILTAAANNSSGHYKRATSTAVQTALANASGFIATFIYTPDQMPRYQKGHTIALACVVFAWFMSAVQVLHCLWENKARREGRRDSNIAKYRVLLNARLTKAPIGDRHPDFMFTP
ncbi:hypothetical protein M378DRAFT_164300 [Amanita muscaria Koide BX008]|uniref:Major facilitator superfamily (MFS) profile domain-containing protein n=1 Tax=Amanita muscaria (strain Koide BX008) TaxID=946122 RepID=A0A0C2SK93_AMAMK|nr:hypothetical protein M378DRAFT_164300 [Amanita muscaria Koide BX008]